MSKDSGEKCPVCNTIWTETKFGRQVWKDCKPCGKTSEDLMKLDTIRSDKGYDKDVEDWYSVLSDWGQD